MSKTQLSPCQVFFGGSDLGASSHMSAPAAMQSEPFADPVLMQMLYHIPWGSRAAGHICWTVRRPAILTIS